MTSRTTTDYDDRLHRLAAPTRAPATYSLVDPEERGELESLLALTNLVESHRAGDRKIVPSKDDFVGEYKDYILAPFAYRARSRFSDGSFGILYAAESELTSIREISHYLTRVYQDSNAPAQEVTRLHLTLRIVAALVDVRLSHVPHADKKVYDPEDDTASQRFGAAVSKTHLGVLYDSVRRAGGTCVGAFVPRIVSDVRLESAVSLVWDGKRLANYKIAHAL